MARFSPTCRFSSGGRCCDMNTHTLIWLPSLSAGLPVHYMCCSFGVSLPSHTHTFPATVNQQHTESAQHRQRRSRKHPPSPAIHVWSGSGIGESREPEIFWLRSATENTTACSKHASTVLLQLSNDSAVRRCRG